MSVDTYVIGDRIRWRDAGGHWKFGEVRRVESEADEWIGLYVCEDGADRMDEDAWEYLDRWGDIYERD